MVALVVLLFGAAPAHAALIAVDGWVAGDQRLTRDTSSGFDWLDLTATENMSLSTFEATFTDLTSMGFRLATDAEVNTLFTDAGATLFGNNPSPNYQAANYAPGILLQTLLGCSLCTESTRPSLPAPYGYAYDASSQGLVAINGGYEWGYFSTIADGTAFIGTSGSVQLTDATYHQPGSGLFIVRDTPAGDSPLPGVDPTTLFTPPPQPVPEPATWILAAAGLTALQALKRSLDRLAQRKARLAA